jgi:glycosyltransferase involved in cell wall biosynthesis
VLSFSIVIPTYNRANLLQQALQSVLHQSHSMFEVIIIDDGSVDNTEEIVESMSDDRISYHRIENSGGPARPRNLGIVLAKNEWICFLDSDDIWHYDKLMVVANAIEENPCIDLICHDEYLSVHGKTSGKILRYGPLENKMYQSMLILGNRVSTSAVTVKKAFLKEHDLRFNESPNYTIVEDYDLWLRVAYHQGNFHFIHKALGEYRVSMGNISSAQDAARHNLTALLTDHVYVVQKFSRSPIKLWKKVNVVLNLHEAKATLASGNYWKFCHLVFGLMKNSPIELLAFGLLLARTKIILAIELINESK